MISQSAVDIFIESGCFSISMKEVSLFNHLLPIIGMVFLELER